MANIDIALKAADWVRAELSVAAFLAGVSLDDACSMDRIGQGAC
jgi:hypothetical protein